MGDECMYLEQPAKHQNDARVAEVAAELAEDLRTSVPIVGIARHYAQLEAELERVRAALRLMSRHAEEQNLLMPLHEQRQITEALGA